MVSRCPRSTPAVSVVSTVPSTTTSTFSTGPAMVIVRISSPPPSMKPAPKVAPSAVTDQSTTFWLAQVVGVSRWLWVTQRIGASKA